MLRKEIDHLKDLATSLNFEQVKYKKLFEYAQRAIVLICKNKYIDCNKAAIKLFGYDSKEEFLCNESDGFYHVMHNLKKLLLLEVKKITNSDADNYPQKISLKYLNLNGEQSISATISKIDISDKKCFVVAFDV